MSLAPMPEYLATQDPLDFIASKEDFDTNKKERYINNIKL